MPKKPVYDKIALQQILSNADCRTIDDDGRLLPPSHEVYRTIANMMADKGSVITPKHVHTIINNNRNGFRDLIMDLFGIQKRELSISVNRSNYSDGECADQTTDTVNSLNSIKLNLVISGEKWENIKPKETTYGKRIYWKLREGWTDVVAEALWVQHHLDCVFVFKNHNVYLSAISKFFLTIDGFCRECNAKLHCSLLKEPTKAVDVILQCNIDGIRAASHSGKKRQLRGARRLKVADYLIDGRKDAVTWRRKEANRIKKFGDKEPPILPSNAVIRKAKEQRLLSKYGLQFGNPVLNLLKSAEHGKFVGCIQSIGVYKFHCIYWLPEQLQIYISRCRDDPDATVAFDATARFAKLDGQNHILLYQCMLVTKDGSVPVFQMVSSDQRALIVNGFLGHILAANAPIPPIVVTDFGWSLMIAVAQVFGKCASFNDYLQKCYDALVNKSMSLPSTFMRSDVCHLLKMVTQWPSLKGKDKSLVRRFYKRCVGKACQISNLEDLSYFLESVLVVALSKCIGYGADGKHLPSVHRLRFLSNQIKGIELKNDNEHDDDEATEKSDDSKEESAFNLEHIADGVGMDKPGWKSWRDELYGAAVKIADQSSEGDTINACYNLDFAKRLKRYLLPYVPLWTAIMVPVFGRGSLTATSAAVESEFSDMKHRDFKGEIPMRIDRFVLQHLERINEKIKERCKASDGSLQNRDGRSNAPDNANLNESSETEADSKFENQSNSMEVDHPHQRTPEPEEISFDVTPNNKCSTPNDSVMNILPSLESKLTEPPLESAVTKTQNIIPVPDSSRTVYDAGYKTAEMSRDENIPADNDWNVREEWGGLNKNAKRKVETGNVLNKKRSKPTSLDDCPEWDFIKHSKTAHAPVLLNGNISGSVRLNNQYLNVTSTCAFDSIFQVVLNALLANKVYFEKLKSSDCPIINLAQSVSEKKKILREHYVQRAQILTGIPIFEGTVTTYTRNIQRLDVECNAAHLAQYLLEKEPSYSSNVVCSCGYTNRQKYTFISVNVDIILCRGLHLMQEAIEDSMAVERSCYKCKRKIPCVNEYGSHLVIDTTVVSDPGYPNRRNIVVSRLDSLKNVIEVGGKTYMVAAVVDYSAEKKHYTTYGLTGEFWYKYDGLIKKRASVTPKTTITPHLVLYAICSNR